MQNSSQNAKISSTDALGLDDLLHPARAFGHPMEVVHDPDLTLNEKRAILSSWASDACALEAAPELRATHSGAIVRWDDIMDALRQLDREARRIAKPTQHYKRVLALKKAGLIKLSKSREMRARSPE